MESDRASAETTLAMALGLGPEDRIQAAEEDRPMPTAPASEEEAVQAALAASKDLRQIRIPDRH